MSNPSLIEQLKQDSQIKANTAQLLADKKPITVTFSEPVQFPFLVGETEQYQGNDNNRRVAERVAAEQASRNSAAASTTDKAQFPSVGPQENRVEVKANVSAHALDGASLAKKVGNAASPAPFTSEPVTPGGSKFAKVPTASAPAQDTKTPFESADGNGTVPQQTPAVPNFSTPADAPAPWKPNN